MGTYAEAYEHSLADPDSFWRAAAEGVSWDRRPTVILDDSHAPLYRWFSDGRLNTCFNALDRHVINGRADQPALVHESAYSGLTTTLTYAQLLEQVAAFAGALRACGVDRKSTRLNSSHSQQSRMPSSA